MTRRIVQISAWTTDESGGTDVLCDDGSVWSYKDGVDWYRLPDIPQDEPAEPDPIAEVEAQGAVLRIDWDTNRIVWAMDADGLREPIATHMSNGSATLTHLRAAAARLLARVRGSK